MCPYGSLFLWTINSVACRATACAARTRTAIPSRTLAALTLRRGSRDGLQVTGGATVSTGGLTVAAGGLQVTGGTTVHTAIAASHRQAAGIHACMRTDLLVVEEEKQLISDGYVSYATCM